MGRWRCKRLPQAQMASSDCSENGRLSRSARTAWTPERRPRPTTPRLSSERLVSSAMTLCPAAAMNRASRQAPDPRSATIESSFRREIKCWRSALRPGKESSEVVISAKRSALLSYHSCVILSTLVPFNLLAAGLVPCRGAVRVPESSE